MLPVSATPETNEATYRHGYEAHHRSYENEEEGIRLRSQHFNTRCNSSAHTLVRVPAPLRQWLSRAEVKHVYARLHNYEPRDADFLDLQCLDSVEVLQRSVSSIPNRH